MQSDSITTPRYGGDKLAFKPGISTDPDELSTIHAITAVIDVERQRKRKAKEGFEREKEDQIKKANDTAKEELDDLKKQKGKISEIEFEVREKKITDRKIKRRKDALYAFHAQLLTGGGWRWHDIKARLLDYGAFAVPVTVDDVPFGGVGDGVALVRSAVTHNPLYAISFGRSRFNFGADSSDETFRSKIGAGGDIRKQYVADRNGVMTRRFVTRAVTIYHVASMFGLKITPPPKTAHVEDAKLGRVLSSEIAARICREIDDVGADPTVEPAFQSDGRTPIAEQRPRYRDPSFGAHADVFDIRRAASCEAGSRENLAFDPYRARSELALTTGEKTKLPIVAGFAEGRKRTDTMQPNERASMQVRNGSGTLQPYLSTASIQVFDGGSFNYTMYKFVRANKGERFDTGAENQATVLVDLAIASRLGVDIVNQHAVESDQYKIAYDRYYDKNNIPALERRVAHKLYERREDGSLFDLPGPLGGHLKQRLTQAGFADIRATAIHVIAAHAALVPIWPWDIGIDRDEFGTLSYDAINKIMGLRGAEVDHTREPIGRSAAGELDEYIYSARKNREVLLDWIPVACVTHIKLNGETGKWPGLEDTTGMMLERWYEFSSVAEKLRTYLTGKSGTEYKNLIEMFKRAAAEKQTEFDRT